MTLRTRLRVSLTTLAVGVPLLFLFASCCKHVMNEYDRSVSKSQTILPALSIDEARRRGTFVDELTCSPGTLQVDGLPLVIGKCWIERAASPEPEYVWSTRYEPLNYFWLNVQIDDGAILLADADRFRFDTESLGLTNQVEGIPSYQFVAISRPDAPALPIKLSLIDRKAQVVVGTLTLTRK
jgi:hypothetical protein